MHRDELDLLVEIKGILFHMDMSSLANQYGFVLWFLPALFFARLFLLLIQKITQNVFYNFIMVVLLFFISFYIDLPFALDNALNSVIWVYIGFVYFNYYRNCFRVYFNQGGSIIVVQNIRNVSIRIISSVWSYWKLGGCKFYF